MTRGVEQLSSVQGNIELGGGPSLWNPSQESLVSSFSDPVVDLPGIEVSTGYYNSPVLQGAAPSEQWGDDLPPGFRRVERYNSSGVLTSYCEPIPQTADTGEQGWGHFGEEGLEGGLVYPPSEFDDPVSQEEGPSEQWRSDLEELDRGVGTEFHQNFGVRSVYYGNERGGVMFVYDDSEWRGDDLGQVQFDGVTEDTSYDRVGTDLDLYQGQVEEDTVIEENTGGAEGNYVRIRYGDGVGEYLMVENDVSELVRSFQAYIRELSMNS
jgi:hypothetical protein